MHKYFNFNDGMTEEEKLIFSTFDQLNNLNGVAKDLGLNKRSDFVKKVEQLSKHYSVETSRKRDIVRYNKRNILLISYYSVQAMVSPDTFHTFPFSNRLFVLAAERSVTKQEKQQYVLLVKHSGKQIRVLTNPYLIPADVVDQQGNVDYNVYYTFTDDELDHIIQKSSHPDLVKAGINQLKVSYNEFTL